MVIRIILIIFLASTAFAELCTTCHSEHYEKTGSCISCHRGDGRTSRKNIAHFGLITSSYADFKINAEAVEKGRKITEKASCRRCHLIGGKGNDLAPDLSASAAKNTAEKLDKSISEPTDFMPKFYFTKTSRTSIIKYLLGTSVSETSKNPYAVYFTDSSENVFDKKCGGCHRVITSGYGPSGIGDTAPNLSGLYSEFYPQRKAIGKPWDKKILKEWMKNPRSHDKNTLMAPVPLTEKESEEIIRMLEIEKTVKEHSPF